LPQYQSFADWQVAKFGSTNAPNGQPDNDADLDRASNYLEFLTRTEPLQATSVWGSATMAVSDGSVLISYPQVANRGFEVQSAGSLNTNAIWQPLDVPENAPFYSATNRVWTTPDALASTNRFYRVRPFEL
jgi:hypothetical protein